MDNVLEGKVKEDEKGIVGLLSSEGDPKKAETIYPGIELIKDEVYAGPTGIKYWM